MDCLSESLDGLTEKELKEVDRWLELYETHDKYTFIGHLVDDPVNDILEHIEEEDAALAEADGDGEFPSDDATDDAEEERVVQPGGETAVVEDDADRVESEGETVEI